MDCECECALRSALRRRFFFHTCRSPHAVYCSSDCDVEQSRRLLTVGYESIAFQEARLHRLTGRTAASLAFAYRRLPPRDMEGPRTPRVEDFRLVTDCPDLNFVFQERHARRQVKGAVGHEELSGGLSR
jgi:hypothetical protein